MKPTIFLTLLSLTLYSCSDEKIESPNNGSNIVVDPVEIKVPEDPKELILMDNELVDRKIFLSDVRAGDKVTIKAKGVRTIPQLDDQVFKYGEVSWVQRFCLDPKQCIDLPRKDRCLYQYRKQLVDQTEPINMSNTEHHRFRAMIDDKEVELGTPTISDDGVYTFSFTVLEEMIKESDELYLDILHPKTHHYLEIGFIGLSGCSHQHNTDFEMHGNTFSKREHFFPTEEYTVSAEIKF